MRPTPHSAASTLSHLLRPPGGAVSSPAGRAVPHMARQASSCLPLPATARRMHTRVPENPPRTGGAVSLPQRHVSTLPGLDPVVATDGPGISLSFRTLASLVVTSAVGLVLGSLAAIGLSHALEATGVFAYVDEDEEGDADHDEGQVDDGNANVVVTNVDLAFQPSEVQVLGKGEEEQEGPPLLGVMARRLALEATGDLTLSATVNLHRWDPAARAFQLMQLKSFLHALDDALHTTHPDGTVVPVPLDDDTAKEVAAVRAFAQGTVERIQARLKADLVARPADSSNTEDDDAVV